MSNKAKDLRPRGLRPMKSIEISETNVKPRFILMIVFLVIGAIALGGFVWSLLTTDPGWTTVEVASSEKNCSGDFIFTYCLGEGDLSPTAENKQVNALYTDATVRAYKLFNKYESFAGVKNIYYINSHPGEIIELDPILYNAFSVAIEHGGRYVYLSSLYAEYEGLFFGADSSAIVEDSDPYVNEEVAEHFARLAEYAANEDSIKLELLGDNKVRLVISEEYKKYAEENGVEVFVDFSRATNAFIIDYFAETMKAGGFTKGCISSYDGYVRNLDDSDTEYSLNIFDRQGQYIYNAAKMNYSSARAIVSLRSFPIGELDRYDYYVSPVSGDIIPPYIDITDGLYKTATTSLTAYSSGSGCAEILMKLLSAYVDTELDTEALAEYSKSGVWSVWLDEQTICYNDKNLNLSDVYKDENIVYKTEYVE